MGNSKESALSMSKVHGQGAAPVTLGVTFDGEHFAPIQPLSRPGRVNYPGAEKPENGYADGNLAVRREAETNGSKLWRVYDKLYDLEKYMDFHPGGRHWLEYMRGCDCTEAFESHHMDIAKAKAVLEKLYVRDVLPGEFLCGDRFDFSDEDGFWNTLRTRALQRLKEAAGPGATTMEATAATPAMKAACAAALSQFMAAHALAVKNGSPLTAAAAGVFMIGVWGVGHNFLHQSADKAGMWKHAISLCPGFTSREFQITHALSHHTMTNLPTDFESAFYTSDGRQGYPSPEARLRHWFLKAFVIGPLQASVTVVNALRSRSFEGLFSASLPFLQLGTYRLGRGSWREALKLWVIQLASFNLLFLPFAIGVHHNAADPEGEGKELLENEKTQRATLSWHEGELGASDDWGIHQVNATEDHTLFGQGPFPEVLSNWLSLTCFGYLNDHKLHHLFPAVDHSKHQILREVFEETCREFKVPLKVRGTGELAASFHRYAQKKEVLPITSRL